MTPRPRKNVERIRALVYTRVSTDSQAESGLSLDHQLTKCRALAVVNDYDVTEEITDAGESAASLDRPGMARVMTLIKCRKIEAVLIAKLDRLTRSVSDLANILDLCSRHHVALVSASESLNTESAAGRMVVRIMATVSQWEREAIGERTRDALSAKRRRGGRTSRHAPLGFQFTPGAIVDNRQTYNLEPNEAERDQLRVIAECRAAGFSWEGTARELARIGYVTRSGRAWTWNNVRSAHSTALRIGTLECS